MAFRIKHKRKMPSSEAREFFDRYAAARQREDEAALRTPAGEASRSAWNDALLKRLRAKKNPRKTRLALARSRIKSKNEAAYRRALRVVHKRTGRKVMPALPASYSPAQRAWLKTSNMTWKSVPLNFKSRKSRLKNPMKIRRNARISPADIAALRRIRRDDDRRLLHGAGGVHRRRRKTKAFGPGKRWKTKKAMVRYMAKIGRLSKKARR